MTTINNLDPSVPDSALPIARATAIHQYTIVEQSLSGLFALLLGTDQKSAGIVFFRITGSWQRNQAIELLLQNKFGTQYDTYFHGWKGESGRPKTPGMFALIRQLDEMRNQIVHWTIAVNIGIEDGKTTRHETLIPPNVWSFMEDRRDISVAQLNEFSQKADFVSRSLNMFSFIFAPNIPEASKQPWRGIFQQPCTYPPPESHPLIRKPKAPDTPPQSS